MVPYPKTPLSNSLILPILNEMVASGLRYGGHYLVEFEPDSLWYETSLTIAARALKNGVRTEYHTFQHVPSDVRESLSSLGLNLERLEQEGAFRVWDTFTYLTDLGLAPEAQAGASHTWEIYKPTFFADLTEEVASMVKAGVSENEKRWLHIDDNTSVLNRYLEESEIVNIWQTRLIPYARVREVVNLLSIAVGVASDQFYKQMESLCDGIIDFRTREESGQVEHYMRIRTLHGKTHDSRWRRLRLSDDGMVTVHPKPLKESQLGMRGWVKGPKD